MWVTSSCLVAKLYQTLCDPMHCSTPGFSVLHCLLEFAQTHVHGVGDAIQPTCPLSPFLLLPSIFPSIRVFSYESTLHTRWPKYWSFSFSFGPSNEYSGLISFRIEFSHLGEIEWVSASGTQHHGICSLSFLASSQNQKHPCHFLFTVKSCPGEMYLGEDFFQ